MRKPKVYHITEVVTYRVTAATPAQAEKKLLKQVKAFKDDSVAELDGVEFLEVREREVVLVGKSK